jgi:hypothetical protein
MGMPPAIAIPLYHAGVYDEAVYVSQTKERVK